MMVQHQVPTVPVGRTKDAGDADVWQDNQRSSYKLNTL